MRTNPVVIAKLEDHPGLPAILAVMSKLTEVSDTQMAALSSRWRNSSRIGEWRSAALSPDSPLVLDVLMTFDSLDALYAADFSYDPPAWVSLTREVTRTGMNAIRDAVAGVFAAPVLPAQGQAALCGPWNTVMGRDAGNGPNSGEHADKIDALVTSAREIAGRCHDGNAKAMFDALSVAAFADVGERDDARASTFEAARFTGKHRRWLLIRRTVATQLFRSCGTCGRNNDSDNRDVARVIQLIADGACALMVADTAGASVTAALIRPVEMLIPTQWPATD